MRGRSKVASCNFLRFISRHKLQVIGRCDVIVTFHFNQHPFTGLHNWFMDCHKYLRHVAFSLNHEKEEIFMEPY